MANASINHKYVRLHGGATMGLWYDSPAQNWEAEALPIGNGRLGAMIFGAADKETIQFNDGWLVGCAGEIAGGRCH